MAAADEVRRGEREIMQRLTDWEAYQKLKRERPVIVEIIHQLKDEYQTATALTKRITNNKDPDELIDLIEQSARVIMKGIVNELD